MRQVTLLMLGLLSVAGTPVVDAATPPGDAALVPLELELQWTGQAVINPARDKIRHVVNDQDLLYVQTSAGLVSVFNAETGRRMWARQIGRNDEYAMHAVSNEDVVLIVSGPIAWGLSKFTGEQLFQHRLALLPTAPPAIDKGAVYFPLGSGTIYAYAIQTLSHLDRYGTLPAGVARPYLWRFVCNELIRHPPVASEEAILFATEANNLHSVSPSGASYYQEFLNAPASAPFAIHSDGEMVNVILPTEDGNLFSFDETRGTLTWDVPVQRQVTQQPLVVGNLVFVITEEMGVSCVSTVTGTYLSVVHDEGNVERWHVPGINSLLGIGGAYVYGIDRNRRIVAIRVEDGRVMGRTSTAGYSLHHQNALTNRLYLVSPAGEILCLKQRGTEFPTYHQNPEQAPLDVDVPTDLPPVEPNDG